MTKKRKLEIEVVAVGVLYGVLVVMVIIGHNILDIGYLVVLTFYLIRLFLCRRKKNKSCK
ncbi:MAG TPA: hypothetical protein IAB59_02530 [Candidatus Onthousia faecipullorum]|uniref:Uncharacterized protein n=1 Tax=Candidatus Onthousia faecipullorum TaxID=2840887 RepID=A0A9D1GAN3_9FIRM|nr:hypothetical protein [Candidatus Onthousia faecipullorum]